MASAEQHHYKSLKEKNIVTSLKEKCGLLLLNIYPFTEVIHEDHPSLVNETLSAATYEYHIHIYLNAKPPY